MGLFSWLFGGSKPKKYRRREPQRRSPLEGFLPGPGTFEIEVVGESHYQELIEEICGGRDEQSAEFYTEASLILEDDNPHDPKAVRVDIGGSTVGYLSRVNARQYRNKLRHAGIPDLRGTCRALILGGWDRGPNDRGFFGVRLDLPTENDLM